MSQVKALKNGTMKEVNSRTNILNQIKENKPNDQTNIELGQFFIDENENSVNKFCQNLVDNDGDYIILDRMDNLQDLLLKEINGRTFADDSAKNCSTPF